MSYSCEHRRVSETERHPGVEPGERSLGGNVDTVSVPRREEKRRSALEVGCEWTVPNRLRIREVSIREDGRV